MTQMHRDWSLDGNNTRPFYEVKNENVFLSLSQLKVFIITLELPCCFRKTQEVRLLLPVVILQYVFIFVILLRTTNESISEVYSCVLLYNLGQQGWVGGCVWRSSSAHGSGNIPTDSWDQINAGWDRKTFKYWRIKKSISLLLILLQSIHCEQEMKTIINRWYF